MELYEVGRVESEAMEAKLSGFILSSRDDMVVAERDAARLSIEVSLTDMEFRVVELVVVVATVVVFEGVVGSFGVTGGAVALVSRSGTSTSFSRASSSR